ncbi:MAG: hypothetical protein ACQ9MH_12880 [Nitrospinales bacterium]
MQKLTFIIFLIFTTLIFVGLGLAEENEGGGLQPGEGRGLVLENCTGCHSTAIILQNRMSRKRWNETITWMQEKQGLQGLNPETRNGILNYLGKYQGPPNSDNDKKSVRKIYQYDYQPNPL